ncbi:MAG: peptide chain release factor 3 [Myxococcota bacterium]
MGLDAEVGRRRTFAIISHPDAGKTTLTEKLLLYAGAVHVAGAVKSRKASRHALSDWMAMEKEKGISITSSVLQFDWGGCRMNLLDTPGHADFSEDTYRVLAAVDAAIMLIDTAKGVEPRTLKLFEVCRLRKLPVITFVNKMDRPGLDPLDLLDDVGRTLNIKTVPLNWPIGRDKEFTGVVDRTGGAAKAVLSRASGPRRHRHRARGWSTRPRRSGAGRAGGRGPSPSCARSSELLDTAGDPFSREAFLAGDVTPFAAGSSDPAHFGVSQLLAALGEPRAAAGRPPHHRGDPRARGAGIASKASSPDPGEHEPAPPRSSRSLRVVSGRFERGMDVTVARSGKTLRLSEAAHLHGAGALDRRGVPGRHRRAIRPGRAAHRRHALRGRQGRVPGDPRFAPEHFARIRLKDPTRRKQLQEGLTQLSQEGHPAVLPGGPQRGRPYLGAVGLLQFEVLKERLATEYNTKAELESAPFTVARWVAGAPEGLAWLQARQDYTLVEDRYGNPVVLSASPWPLNYALSEAPGLELLEISPL